MSEDIYKVWGEFTVLVKAESEAEAEEKVMDAGDPLIDMSEGAGSFSIKPPVLEKKRG